MHIRHPLAAIPLVVAGILLAGCSTGSPDAAGAPEDGGLESMEPITLSVASHDQPPPSASGTGFEVFKDYVAEASDGKITIEPYYAGALVPATEALGAAQSGAADIGYVVNSLFPQDLPVSNWLLKTAAAVDPSMPLGYIQQSAALTELFLSEDALIDEYHNLGLKVLMATSTPSYSLTCTSPIESLADAQGKKVRVAGEVWAKEAESVGMIPVQLTVAEVYDALQRGVIDCAALSATATYNYGLFDIAKYHNAVGMSSIAGITYVMNEARWDSLPPAARKILMDGVQKMFAAFFVKEMQNTEPVADADDVVYENPAALDKEIRAWQKTVLEGLPATAPAQVSDPKAFLAANSALMDKWAKLLEGDLGMRPVPRDPDSIRESYRTASDFDHDAFTQLTYDELFVNYTPQ